MVNASYFSLRARPPTASRADVLRALVADGIRLRDQRVNTKASLTRAGREATEHGLENVFKRDFKPVLEGLVSEVQRVLREGQTEAANSRGEMLERLVTPDLLIGGRAAGPAFSGAANGPESAATSSDIATLGLALEQLSEGLTRRLAALQQPLQESLEAGRANAQKSLATLDQLALLECANQSRIVALNIRLMVCAFDG